MIGAVVHTIAVLRVGSWQIHSRAKSQWCAGHLVILVVHSSLLSNAAV